MNNYHPIETVLLETPQPQRTARNGRRRSRQCRGARARNYVRVFGRVLRDQGSDARRFSLSKESVIVAQTLQVIHDANASGAYASFNRLRKKVGA